MTHPAYLYSIFTLLTILHRVNAQGYHLTVNSNINKTDKKMPESTSFIDLLSKSVFVDKTLFIRDFMMGTLLNPPWCNAILCPPDWGKTTSLDMLKTFLEMQLYPNGSQILPVTSTPNYKLFIEGEYHANGYDIKLEKPLHIANTTYKEAIDQYLGQHPVVWLSFDGFSLTAPDGYIDKLGQIIIKAFQQHKYMIELYDDIIRDPNQPKNVTENVQETKDKFTAYLNGDRNTTKGLQHSIEFLIGELHDYFQTDVFTFMDNYDELFHAIHLDEVRNFFDLTVSSCEPYTIIFAGIIPKSFIGEYTTLNNFIYLPHPFFGYLQQEMDKIYEYYQIPVDQQHKIRYWYGGYENIKRELFNPRSIRNYLNHRQLKPYWVHKNPHNIHLNDIFKSPEFQLAFGRLILGNYYDLEYSTLSDRSWKNFEIEDLRNALAYLNLAGYLTRTELIPPGMEGGRYLSRYLIPNYENMITLQSSFAPILKDLYQPDLYALLTKTSTILGQFLLSDDLVSDELGNTIQPCFKSMTTYLKENINYTTGGTGAYIHTLTMSAVLLKKIHFISWQFADTDVEDEETTTPTPDKRKGMKRLVVSQDDKKGGKKTTKKPAPKKKLPDIIKLPPIALSSDTRGIIIEVKKGKAVNSPINQTVLYYRIFENYPDVLGWKDMKFIFFNIMPNESVIVTSALETVDKLRIRSQFEYTTLPPTTTFGFKKVHDA